MQEFSEQKKIVERKLRRRLKSASKGVQKILNQLAEAEGWEKNYHNALLLQSNLYKIKPGTKEICLTDWNTGCEVTFQLDPVPHKQIAALFRKSKKQREGIEPLRQHLLRSQKWVDDLQQALASLETIESLDEIIKKFELEEKSPSEKEIKKKIPYREFFSKTGIPIWVGKTAKDNDALTFSYANGLDWWLHVSGYSGSHVVIRAKEPDPETIQDAIQLAIEYSKAKNTGKVEVCVTQCKYVSKFKGSKAGAVHISKHKRVMGESDRERLIDLLRN